ncbi:hypothetical protein RRG08_023727 [Elysia crispata]|uniref:Uncharacterized protein n=1 Tax=Elysia crispata TaxID=231223 RepID=A0AAE0Z0E0_9GAST|nr:hypothetical protein RRG08_023727 [Elysia crispata]
MLPSSCTGLPPLQNGLAPSELLMGRRLKTKLPFVQKAQPQKPDFPLLIQKEFRYRKNQRQNYNRRHAVREAPELQPGDPVFVKDLRRSGSVNKYHNPRSYIVHTEQGTIRSNRSHLVATPTPDQSPPMRSVPNAPDSSSVAPRSASPEATETSATVRPEIQPTPRVPGQPRVTRSGRSVIPPKRLDL